MENAITFILFNDELNFFENYLTENNVQFNIYRHQKTSDPVIEMENSPVNAMYLFWAGQEYQKRKHSSHSLSR